jgi:hypothetical protein
MAKQINVNLACMSNLSCPGCAGSSSSKLQSKSSNIHPVVPSALIQTLFGANAPKMLATTRQAIMYHARLKTNLVTSSAVLFSTCMHMISILPRSHTTASCRLPLTALVQQHVLEPYSRSSDRNHPVCPHPAKRHADFWVLHPAPQVQPPYGRQQCSTHKCAAPATLAWRAQGTSTWCNHQVTSAELQEAARAGQRVAAEWRRPASGCGKATASGLSRWHLEQRAAAAGRNRPAGGTYGSPLQQQNRAISQAIRRAIESCLRNSDTCLQRRRMCCRFLKPRGGGTWLCNIFCGAL